MYARFFNASPDILLRPNTGEAGRHYKIALSQYSLIALYTMLAIYSKYPIGRNLAEIEDVKSEQEVNALSV